jgi:hypothetical protein
LGSRVGAYQCSDRRRGDRRSDRSGLAWHAAVTRRVSLLNGDAVMRNYHLNPSQHRSEDKSNRSPLALRETSSPRVMSPTQTMTGWKRWPPTKRRRFSGTDYVPGIASGLPAGLANRKILLPRKPEESRFAPQQYYYAASKSGVAGLSPPHDGVYADEKPIHRRDTGNSVSTRHRRRNRCLCSESWSSDH